MDTTLLLISILLILTTLLMVLKCCLDSCRMANKNLFIYKYNPDIEITFKYFINALDEKMNVKKNVVFYRHDDKTTYTMDYEVFKSKFIHYIDLENCNSNYKKWFLV